MINKKTITDITTTEAYKELQLSVAAGNLVGKLYDALREQYIDPNSEETLKSLNVLCVRLVFLFFAEDAGILGKLHSVFKYLNNKRADLRMAIIELFKVLDTPVDQRDPYLSEDLAAFPYVNGGLFADTNIVIPRITPDIAELMINECSGDFDWSGISPTIFGAIFESTLNPETRRKGGMHYTSIQNIHKVIDPLFLENLQEELRSITTMNPGQARTAKLNSFHNKLGALTFFDPACGSGNFLTETYICLRRMENDVIRIKAKDQGFLSAELSPIQVSIQQFYGIEINDFAATVAKTALWIAESQMIQDTENGIQHALDFPPLKSNSHIIEGNALTIAWETVAPDSLDYIIGNPPFVGARLQTKEQKKDLLAVYCDENGEVYKNAGNLDYVMGWYFKAAQLMQGTECHAAFVSTNSITQGEQINPAWYPLFTRFNTHIDFAWRTFKWKSESLRAAGVHVVIIGFSCIERATPRIIYAEDQQSYAKNINPYLLDAPNIFIKSRSKPICAVPEIGIGNKPIDDGNYLFKDDEKDEFVKLEPNAEQYFQRWYGSDEFIHNRPRWCLWLGECSPAELRKMPHCLKRVEAVRQFRLASKNAETVKLAERPTHFQTENMPNGNYIVIPATSSEKRIYVPIGFMNHKVLCSDALKLGPNATWYHFGVLTSSVHMAWMRVVCGRLGVGYRYSKDIVYNNFVWPEDQKEYISQTAQGILDARALYPDCSLADLYNERTMPPELRKAHQANDRAVLKAYGFPLDITEKNIVKRLMALYSRLNANNC